MDLKSPTEGLDRAQLLEGLIDGSLPDAHGRYGPFGGRYVPETLVPAITRLEAGARAALDDPDLILEVLLAKVEARGERGRRGTMRTLKAFGVDEGEHLGRRFGERRLDPGRVHGAAPLVLHRDHRRARAPGHVGHPAAEGAVDRHHEEEPLQCADLRRHITIITLITRYNTLFYLDTRANFEIRQKR